MAQPTYEELRAENAHLRQRVAALEAQVEPLQAQVRQLAAQLQEAQRASKRQAAPFSKGPPKDPPATPGRKAGEHYGPKGHRPLPSRPPNEILDVPLPDTCPHCGGPVLPHHACLSCGTYRGKAILKIKVKKEKKGKEKA